MKLKAILAAALAATLTLASCSKDAGTGNQTGESTRVVIKMEQPGTRAIGASQSSQNVTFSDGYVYFVDNNDNITDVFRLVSTTPTPDTNEIQIGATMTFDEVSGNSQDIYILGNVPAQTATVGAAISTVINQAVHARTQTDDVDASVLDNYYLYGKTASPIDHTGATSTAAVTVKPIGSRIEILKFEAVEKDVTNFPQQITGYRIDGIFINNTYTSTTLAGTPTSNTADFTSYGKENGQSPVNFLSGAGIYSAADNGIFYNADETNGIATAVANVATPASDAWVYNILAPTGGEFPHIVIRVSNIQGVSSIPSTENRWMTVTQFLDASSAPVAFEPGKIYTIESFEFNEYDHLDVSPEMKTVTATVTVTVPQWEQIVVTPW